MSVGYADFRRSGPIHILEYAAIAGDRATANRLAAEIDARPTGPLVLLVKTCFCLCGARSAAQR
ncbi:MAG: hypothetical protein KDI66_20180, partial [Xanthomonadales bacterium]|nr:hypothetical protein [Xanthomonadales bacterium]